MNKRHLCLILSIIMMISFTSIEVFAVTENPAMNATIKNDQYKRDLAVIKSQNYDDFIFIKEIGNKEWNHNIYKDPFYNQKIIYGKPTDISSEYKISNVTKRKEYRYLGYNVHGSPVTNHHFPNDVSSSDHPKKWLITNKGIFVSAGQAKASWDKLQLYFGDDLWEMNQNVPLVGHGLKESDNFTLSRARGLTDGYWKSHDQTEILTYAGLFSAGSIKVEHTEHRMAKYATFDTMPLTNENSFKDTIKINNSTQPGIIEFPNNKNSIDVTASVIGKMNPSNANFKKSLIKKYEARVLSYEIQDTKGNSIMQKNISGSIGNTIKDISSKGYEVSKNQKITINKSDLKGDGGIYYLTVKGETYIESVLDTEKRTMPLKLKVSIDLKKDKTPPNASIDAPKEVFVGERVSIAGYGNDKVDTASALSYIWNGNDKDLTRSLGNKYPNIGGYYTFTRPGAYKLKLEVTNTQGLKGTAAHNIIVKPKGDILLNFNATNNPVEIIYKDGQNLQKVKVNAEGYLKGLKESGKTVKMQSLKVALAPKSYVQGNKISLANSKINTLPGNNTSIKNTFNIDVDTGGKEYTQYFRVMYEVVYTDGKKDSKDVILNTKFSKDTPPPPVNSAPKAQIIAPFTVVAGDDVLITGIGADDESLTILYWGINKTTGINGWDVLASNMGPNVSAAKVWFSQTGIYNLTLKVVDDKGMLNIVQHSITVTPPLPQIVFNWDGTKKENRKLMLDIKGSHSGSQRFGIDWGKTKWKFYYDEEANTESVRTNNFKNNTINRTTNLEKLDLLFKKKGTYTLQCTLQNEFGANSTDKIDFKIEEDLKPKASIYLDSNQGIKDLEELSPNDLRQGQAIIYDSSSSPDNDIIVQRGYVAIFDTNNNESFEDEQAFIYDESYTGDSRVDMPWSDSINPYWRPIGLYKDIGNLDITQYDTKNYEQMTFKTTHVGKILFKVFIKEEFGQQTIERFVDITDRKTNSNL